jgi:hypothetical protein
MPFVGSYANCPAAATTQVLTGRGALMGVIVRLAGTAAVDIYDNTTTTGTPIFTVPATGAATDDTYNLGLPVNLGIRVVSPASGHNLLCRFAGD